MRNVILSVFRIGILSCFALSTHGISCLAAEFEAILYEYVGDIPQMGNIYVKDSLYRMDQVQKGDRFTIFVDEEACETKVFSFSKKEYIEIACDDKLSLENDPFQTLRRMVASCDVRYIGLETVNGYECEKSVLSFTGNDVATQWISPELSFPVRIVNHLLKNKITELRDIEEGSVDDTLFIPPTGFEKTVKFTETPPEPADWADQVPSAPIMEPPFEVDVSPGDIIRIKVEDGMKIDIIGWNKIDGISIYTVTPFLNGKNTRDLEKGLVKISSKKAIGIRSFEETAAEADEIVIRMREGKVTMEGKRAEIELK